MTRSELLLKTKAGAAPTNELGWRLGWETLWSAIASHEA
jgi:hypothetical protein